MTGLLLVLSVSFAKARCSRTNCSCGQTPRGRLPDLRSPVWSVLDELFLTLVLVLCHKRRVSCEAVSCSWHQCQAAFCQQCFEANLSSTNLTLLFPFSNFVVNNMALFFWPLQEFFKVSSPILIGRLMTYFEGDISRSEAWVYGGIIIGFSFLVSYPWLHYFHIMLLVTSQMRIACSAAIFRKVTVKSTQVCLQSSRFH